MNLDDQLRNKVRARLRTDAELTKNPTSPDARRAVARALAAEGIVASPQDWARMVKELTHEAAGPTTLEIPGALHRHVTEALAEHIAALAQDPSQRESLVELIALERDLREHRPWLVR